MHNIVVIVPRPALSHFAKVFTFVLFAARCSPVGTSTMW